MNPRKLCSVIPPKDPIASYNAAIAENPKNAASGNSGIRAVGYYRKFWKAGRTLRVSFLDWTPLEHRLAFQAIFKIWEEHANLRFELSYDKDAEIRIRTLTDEDRSTIGTDALTIDQNEPTMFISEDPLSDCFASNLLHEIGHAMGFAHEHLHREANIPWNKPKVYQYYFDLCGWEKDVVDANVLTPIPIDAIVDTEYDKKSIMHYEVDKDLTDGVWEATPNLYLSEKDKYAASKLYPADPDDVPWKDW